MSTKPFDLLTVMMFAVVWSPYRASVKDFRSARQWEKRETIVTKLQYFTKMTIEDFCQYGDCPVKIMITSTSQSGSII